MWFLVFPGTMVHVVVEDVGPCAVSLVKYIQLMGNMGKFSTYPRKVAKYVIVRELTTI